MGQTDIDTFYKRWEERVGPIYSAEELLESMSMRTKVITDNMKSFAEDIEEKYGEWKRIKDEIKASEDVGDIIRVEVSDRLISTKRNMLLAMKGGRKFQIEREIKFRSEALELKPKTLISRYPFIEGLRTPSRLQSYFYLDPSEAETLFSQIQVEKSEEKKVD